MMADEARQMVVLTPNVQRILAALHRVMTVAKSRGRPVSQYDLVKTLFLADRAHLNEWGRPITYDNYFAMKHGPVPSLAYDLLKGNEKTIRDYRIDRLPWSVLEQGKGTKHYDPLDGANADEAVLSESDICALDDALATVIRLGFGQIMRLTHEDPAYQDAWREDGGKAAYGMKLGLLFDDPNFDQAEMLAEYSPYV